VDTSRIPLLQCGKREAQDCTKEEDARGERVAGRPRWQKRKSVRRRQSAAYRCFSPEDIVFFSTTWSNGNIPSVATRPLWGSRLPYDSTDCRVTAVQSHCTYRSRLCEGEKERGGRERQRASEPAREREIERGWWWWCKKGRERQRGVRDETDVSAVCPRRRPGETRLYRCEPINITR
jgi:hypothetical protein